MSRAKRSHDIDPKEDSTDRFVSKLINVKVSLLSISTSFMHQIWLFVMDNGVTVLCLSFTRHKLFNYIHDLKNSFKIITRQRHDLVKKSSRMAWETSPKSLMYIKCTSDRLLLDWEWWKTTWHDYFRQISPTKTSFLATLPRFSRWYFGWLGDWLTFWLEFWLVGWFVGQWHDWLAFWLVGWFVGRWIGWLIFWLVGWFVGRWVG